MQSTIHKSLEITIMQSMSHLFLARCMYVLHFATAHVPILTY